MMDKKVLFLENHDWTYTYETNNLWCTQALNTLCDASEGIISEDDMRTEFNLK